MNTTPNQLLTRSNERMHTQMDWLDSRHSFSFGGHYDPERIGFGPLRVVNDDRIGPGGGFPPHPHRDMEIVSLVLEGALAHKDSLGNGSTIRAGDVQYMSAGSGVVHSEFNPSDDESMRLLQIWIEPNAKDLEPRYAEHPILGETADAWQLILSADGREGSVAIRQDAELRTAQLSSGAELLHETTGSKRGLWLFVIEGEVAAAGERLGPGDSLALASAGGMTLRNEGRSPAKILLFDVPL